MTHKKNLFVIIVVFLLASLVFYSYFWFFVPHRLQYLFRNWDGPSYVVIAKSFYNPQIIDKVNSLRLPNGYFAAQFPLYPFFIRLFSFIGYYRSMIFVSQLFSLLFIISFYRLAVFLKLRHPLLLSLALIFISPRWFTVSHVGSSEPVFLFFLTLVLYYLFKKKYLKSALLATLVQLARPQGILLFIGISAYCLFQFVVVRKQTLKELFHQYKYYLLIPISLCGVFLLQFIQYHDLFKFFQTHSSFVYLKPIPFAIFSPTFSGWKEIYIFYYLIAFTTVRRLLISQKYRIFGFIALMYALPLPFLVHEDINRYSLPLLPFVFIAHHRLLSSKNFLIILSVFIPAIIIFSINYALLNLSP